MIYDELGRTVDWKSYFEMMVKKFPGAKMIRNGSPWVRLRCEFKRQRDVHACEMFVASLEAVVTQILVTKE